MCEREHGADLPRLSEVYAPMLKAEEAPVYWRRMFQSLMNYQIALFFFTGPREGEDEKVSHTRYTLARYCIHA